MNLMEQSYDAMRLLLKCPMNPTQVAISTGREIHHVRRGLDNLIKYGYVTKYANNYSITDHGIERLSERDGVKHKREYNMAGRIHPNVDWPWVYREAA